MTDDPRDLELDPDTHCPGHGTAYDRNGVCPDCQWWQERQAQGHVWHERSEALKRLNLWDDDIATLQQADEELGAALAARFDKDADQ